jgi:hypothetical protein
MLGSKPRFGTHTDDEIQERGSPEINERCLEHSTLWKRFGQSPPFSCAALSARLQTSAPLRVALALGLPGKTFSARVNCGATGSDYVIVYATDK